MIAGALLRCAREILHINSESTRAPWQAMSAANATQLDSILLGRTESTAMVRSYLTVVLRRRNTSPMASVTKTVKVSRDLAGLLARAARRRGVSESELIREGVQRVIQDEPGLDMQALVGSDLGVGEGPRDLPHNRKRLSGYGRSRHR